MHAEHHAGGWGYLRSRAGIALIVFLAIAAFFILTEHTAHAFGYLPYGLLLVCLLMHLFMHGGHGGGHGHHGDRPATPGDQP